MKNTAKQLLSALAFAAISNVAIAADHTVKMLNNGADGLMVFEPGFIRAEPGDTVTFVATDAGHNTASVVVPDGATAWNGAMGEEVTITLDKEGVYVYQCTPHLVMAMVGVIQVGSAVNKADAEAAASTLTSTMAMNQDRLAGYLSQIQ
ncbi:MAG: pseudoazurin [Pseudomonadota bacterium]